MESDNVRARLLLANAILDLKETLDETNASGYEPPANVEISRCSLEEIVMNLLKARDLFGKE